MQRAVKLNRNTSAAAKLASDKDRILETWSKRLVRRSTAAARLSPNDLIGRLAQFLDEMAVALRPDTTDEMTSLEVCREHGGQRAQLVGYTLRDVVYEYSLLRQVIYEILAQEVCLDLREQAVILNSIDQGVGQAVEKFVEAQDTIRRQFIAILSHDLRNPISAAMMCAQLILKKLDAPEVGAAMAGKILDSLQRADRMLQDLLDLSCLEAGQTLSIERSHCDLKEIAVEVSEEFATRHGKRFDLTFKGLTSGYWSAEGLRRILENLLSNAVKYSFPGTTIYLHLDGHEDEVRMSVKSYGTPLSSEELTRLATPYYRAPAAIDGGKRGWGIGLTMVRGMVQAHGGRFLVESTKDHGTTFTIALPPQL